MQSMYSTLLGITGGIVNEEHVNSLNAIPPPANAGVAQSVSAIIPVM